MERCLVEMFCVSPVALLQGRDLCERLQTGACVKAQFAFDVDLSLERVESVLAHEPCCLLVVR